MGFGDGYVDFHGFWCKFEYHDINKIWIILIRFYLISVGLGDIGNPKNKISKTSTTIKMSKIELRLYI